MPIPNCSNVTKSNVKHITVGQMKRLTEDELATTERTYVVAGLVVLVPYETFLEMQNAIHAAPMSLPMPGPGTPIAQGGPVSTGHKADPSSPLRGV